jgi:hypothetical protein
MQSWYCHFYDIVWPEDDYGWLKYFTLLIGLFNIYKNIVMLKVNKSLFVH